MEDAEELEFDEVLRETDLALLISFEEDRAEWIPKSQIREMRGKTVVLPRWLVEKNGLEVYVT